MTSSFGNNPYFSFTIPEATGRGRALHMNERNSPEEIILDATLRLPPEQRRAYLEKACSTDGLMRERLENRLQPSSASIPWAGGYESTANGPIEQTVASRLLTETEGDRISRYQLVERIGEGGMGRVWRAQQLEPVQREVALKVIKIGMDTREFVMRFEAELHAVGRIGGGVRTGMTGRT
jgi:hypothetical protein